jgi:dienelactone hydrolase
VVTCDNLTDKQRITPRRKRFEEAEKMKARIMGCILALLIFILAACAPAAPEAAPTFAPTHTPTPVPTLPSGVISDLAYAGASSDQTLTLHLPEGRHPSAPVLFLPHGQYFPELVTYFTQRGYPVISVRTRGETFRFEMQDSLCALAFIHNQAQTYGLDSTRIVSMGASLGGGSTVALAAAEDTNAFTTDCEHTLPESERAAAVIVLAGVLDFSFEQDFPPGYIDLLANYMQGTPDENPEIWGMASALTHIDGGDPPFLLLHGTLDVTVAAHQSQSFAGVLETEGVEFELVLLPGLNHEGLFSSEEAFALIDAFLQRIFE